MAYDYYRTLPGWGTHQYQFAPPPELPFRPESEWSSRDYFNANAVEPDITLFNAAYHRFRTRVPGLNTSFHDAQRWHHYIYGGLGEVETMSPIEIGAAAGYETCRKWAHNHTVFDPIYGDDNERQRDALIGIAIAEASNLWHEIGRPNLDRYNLQEACESAAATATSIIGHWENWYGFGTQTGSQIALDPYALDEPLFTNRRPRTLRRSVARRSPSTSSSEIEYEPSLGPTILRVGSNMSSSSSSSRPIYTSIAGTPPYTRAYEVPHHHNPRGRPIYRVESGSTLRLSIPWDRSWSVIVEIVHRYRPRRKRHHSRHH